MTFCLATSASFAARRGDEVDPDQEMIALGSANVAAGLFQGFAVSTSGLKTCSPNTASYCKARSRIRTPVLRSLAIRTASSWSRRSSRSR